MHCSMQALASTNHSALMWSTAFAPPPGESVSVLKGTDPIAKEECELQAKENMLFAGTAISNGICVGCVTSIGMGTEIGKIQSQIQV